VGEETYKRGDEGWGGGGEYEGVDGGEMEGLQLLSLLHTVGFFFFSPFQVLSVLFTNPTDSTRERKREREGERDTGRHRERGRGRESACVRACVRAAFEALGNCAHRNTVHARGVGVRESVLGACSLLIVALDASTSDTHTHTHCALTHR
jgi:hypothetical protein